MCFSRTANLAEKEIQRFVQQAVDGKSERSYKINTPPVGRPVRVYADGTFIALFYLGQCLSWGGVL